MGTGFNRDAVIRCGQPARGVYGNKFSGMDIHSVISLRTLV